MLTSPETSDQSLIDLLRLQGPLGISELARETGVTATAVRQRLSRLMGQELVRRESQRSGRGRPSHRYLLTEKGLRSAGNNYGDLALTLWREIRAVKDPEVRRGLLQRVAQGLAESYGRRVTGESTAERMKSISELMIERKIPFQATMRGENQLPVITALACPYPDLAQQDRTSCAVERLMLSAVLGESVRRSECRLDGGACCTFEAS